MRKEVAHFALAILVGLPIAGAPATRERPADTCPPGDAMGLVERTNDFRRASGHPEVEPDARLFAAAARLAYDLARRGGLDHVGSDGSTVGIRVVAAGYPRTLAAENLAAGQLDAGEVVRAWAGSPHHRDNMLAPGVRHGGAAHVRGRPACRGCSPDYWVLVLATTRYPSPPVPVACRPTYVAR